MSRRRLKSSRRRRGHSGAIAAKELGGSLSAFSDGPGTGARFVLELPLKPRAKP